MEWFLLFICFLVGALLAYFAGFKRAIWIWVGLCAAIFLVVLFYVSPALLDLGDTQAEDQRNGWIALFALYGGTLASFGAGAAFIGILVGHIVRRRRSQ